ncbi:MAG TPA: CHAD domain-containing protein [Pyrinomonadaceae bacterium]|jgi:CHAD domain-containing protein|nr:CHAD domain-containing protein [Pyrinomonadaceae bacterium]
MAKAKEIAGLDCEAGAFDGISLVLRSRLAEMCDLRDAALDFADPKGVHDMRVASRRLRSALRDFAPYLNKGKALRKRLKSVAGALGAVRDEDVALMALEKLEAEAGDASAGVVLLADERRERRERARRALAAAIDEATLSELRAALDALLLARAPKTRRGKAGNAHHQEAGEPTFRQFGRRVILAGFDELRSSSASLYRPFETEPLHDMRIAAKRLRYAVQLFAQCWGGQLAPLAKEVAEIQSSLGELHDCDVWIADLGARLDNLRRDNSSLDNPRGDDVDGSAQSPDADAAQRRAFVRLLEHFVETRMKHYSDALARWDEWEANGFSQRLADALQTPATAAPPKPSTTRRTSKRRASRKA